MSKDQTIRPTSRHSRSAPKFPRAELARTLALTSRALTTAIDDMLGESTGFSLSQLIFLSTIDRERDLAANQLASALGFSRAAISQHTGWFVERNLIVTYSSPWDDREIRLTLSPSGKKAAKECASQLEILLTELLGQFEYIDFDGLEATLERFRKHVVEANIITKARHRN